MIVLHPLDPGDNRKITREALEYIRTSHKNVPTLAEQWGLTMLQVFDIQDGKIRACPCGCGEPVWRIPGGWSTPSENWSQHEMLWCKLLRPHLFTQETS